MGRSWVMPSVAMSIDGCMDDAAERRSVLSHRQPLRSAEHVAERVASGRAPQPGAFPHDSRDRKRLADVATLDDVATPDVPTLDPVPTLDLVRVLRYPRGPR